MSSRDTQLLASCGGSARFCGKRAGLGMGTSEVPVFTSLLLTSVTCLNSVMKWRKQPFRGMLPHLFFRDLLFTSLDCPAAQII